MTMSPNINHLTLTVDRDLLQGATRDKLRVYCASVLGWKEEAQHTEDGRHLVFRLYHRGHFLNLLEGKTQIVAGNHDHLGIEVHTRQELEEFNARARNFKESVDAALDVGEVHTTGMIDESELPARRNWSFYLIYLLPIKVEFQYHEEVAAKAAAGA